MYRTRFVAHNMPVAGGVARASDMGNYPTEAEALAAIRQYADGAADVARRHDGHDAVVSIDAPNLSAAVYVDGFTLWSEFYAEEIR